MSHAVVLVTFPTEPDDNIIDEVMLPVLKNILKKLI